MEGRWSHCTVNGEFLAKSLLRPPWAERTQHCLTCPQTRPIGESLKKQGNATLRFTFPGAETETLLSTAGPPQTPQPWCPPELVLNSLVPPRFRVTSQCHPAHHQHHGRIRSFARVATQLPKSCCPPVVLNPHAPLNTFTDGLGGV